MVEVNLDEYCQILLHKTNSGEYVWEQAGTDKYRLVMPKGAIVIEKSYNRKGDCLEIVFYGTTSIIYACTLNTFDSFFDQYSELFNVIVSKNNERINNEITELFGE